MLVRLQKMESIELGGYGKGRQMHFVEEIPQIPMAENEQTRMIKTMMTQIQIQRIIIKPTEILQPRIILFLTEEEYGNFNDDVEFVVNNMYNVEMNKGHISIHRAEEK